MPLASLGMAREYRVVDCRAPVVTDEIIVIADTPEHAARLAIGEDLVRGNRQAGALRARVYCGGTGGLTLVRLYARPAEQIGTTDA